MLTLFTIPKPFRGRAAIAQRNALHSWRALGDEVEIVVFGDEEGAAAAASEVGARHVREIERNEWGTPLVSDAFASVGRLASGERLCFANTDIVLLPDLSPALRRLGDRRALVVGRRVDFAVDEELAFDDGWHERLRRAAAERGRLGTDREIDYMVFPRDVAWDLPPLAVGRPGWDNWLLFRARTLGLPVVDATASVLAVHQSHDYEHVPARRGPRWHGPEADANWARVGEMRGPSYGIFDATHVLTPRGLWPALGVPNLKRRIRRHAVFGRGVRLVDALRGS